MKGFLGIEVFFASHPRRFIAKDVAVSLLMYAAVFVATELGGRLLFVDGHSPAALTSR